MYYLYLQSALHEGEILLRKANEFFTTAEKICGISFESGTAEQAGSEALSIVYIATGGTAGLVKAALPELSDNIIIVTSSIQNSLSASMESVTYLSSTGKKARLLHGSDEEVAQQLKAAILSARAVRKLDGMRLGMVGKPSDWLISTTVDYEALKAKTGISVEEITMNELLAEISVSEYEENMWTSELLAKEFDKAQVQQALYIYGAFKRIVDSRRLDGVTVRCFDLLTAVKNTGCLGLAILNACGVYSACESDLPSLISMAILGSVSGEPVFMCNPSRVDRKSNEITFAHCTLPINMPEKYYLDTHFESRIGVAISGDIPLGPVTIFKASADLSHWFISSGEILEDLHDPDLCRTQIRLSCGENVEDFLNSHVGNHYLVCRGDYTEALRLTMEQLGKK